MVSVRVGSFSDDSATLDSNKHRKSQVCKKEALCGLGTASRYSTKAVMQSDDADMIHSYIHSKPRYCAALRVTLSLSCTRETILNLLCCVSEVACVKGGRVKLSLQTLLSLCFSVFLCVSLCSSEFL